MTDGMRCLSAKIDEALLTARAIVSGTSAKPGRPFHWRPDWLGLFVLAFGLRLAAAVVTDAFRHPQLYEYEDLARAMLAGRGFTYGHWGIFYQSYAPPLYAWFCAMVYLAGGTVGTVLVVQMLVSAGHVVLVQSLAERLFQQRAAGLVAGLLMAMNPGLIIYASTKAHPLTFDALFFTLVLWQFWRLRDQPRLGRAVAVGGVIGLGVLSRATVGVFVPLGCLWLLATSARQDWPKLLGPCVVVGVCAVAVVAPWTIRNTLIHHEFVPIVTVDSHVFWRGNNPAATGTSHIDAENLVIDALPAEAEAELRGLPSEMAQSRWFQRRAFEFIEANPGAFARLTLRKLFYFWWFAPQTGVLYPVLWLRGYQVYYVLALLLTGLGLWGIVSRGRARARHECLLIVTLLVGLSGLQSLYYVEARHRWAVEPLVLVLAGGSMVGLSRAGTTRRGERVETSNIW